MEPISPATLHFSRLAAASEEGDCAANEFILPNSIVVIAAPDKSLDTIWFIELVDVSSKVSPKDHSHKLPAGTAFTEGQFHQYSTRFKKITVL